MQKRAATRRKYQNNNIADTESVLGKSLPSNLEAERAVLGSILLHDDNAGIVIERLRRDDLYSNAHRIIFDAVVKIVEENKRVDIITLQDELEKKELLDAVGGAMYLISLQEDIAAVGRVEQHVTIIKEKSILRDLIGSSAEIITNCYSQNQDGIEHVLDQAEQKIFDIANKRSTQSFTQLDIWLKKTFQQLSEVKTHSQGITGVPTGFKRLDEMSSGLQKGDFVVLAARPSMGKTALALRIAQNAAGAGFPVGFFSLEMSAEQLTLRLLSGESGVEHHNIRNATISSDEWVDLTHAAAKLAEMKLFIDDAATQTVMDIRTKARKLKAEHNIQFIVIDYLQLLSASGRFENRHQEVSAISRSLKALAKELEIPVLALSQLSRAVDSRVDKRPMLSDLRESGAIEQDADLIMFLYRDVVYNAETEDPVLSELIVGKQRNGPTGTVYLNFQRELTVFEDTE